MEKDKLTFKIIGCAMNVHNYLGNGFQEVIYQSLQKCLNQNWQNEKKYLIIFYSGNSKNPGNSDSDNN
jgi:hypothetical protein